MNLNITKSTVIKLLVSIIFAAGIICLFLLFKSILPSAVYYSIDTPENLNESPKDYPKQASLKTSISQIEEDAPFELVLHKDSIYAAKDGRLLYKIKASVSELTKSDIENMKNGIEISCKSELYEIVSYLES